MNLRTNKQRLVKQAVVGNIRQPYNGNPYYIKSDGQAVVLPALAGITYEVEVGDCVFDYEADHLEPGVTLKNDKNNDNDGLNLLSCIGNEATVVTGEAKGAKGYVTGKHGGCEHIIVYFKQEDLEKMSIYDTIQIKSYGQGIQLLDYKDIMVMNIDPNLFEKLCIKEENGSLIVPVTHKIPAYLMGSGIGANTSHRGDYDITTTDKNAIKELGLDNLRFGDIVLLEDSDNSYGRAYNKGCVSIGVVIHGECVRMGHGPGVTTIMTCKTGKLKGEISKNVNIANYLNIKNSI